MKAITILQPWASLIAIGAKQYETRSWQTKYRGPIAIHAAKKNPCKMSTAGTEQFVNTANKYLCLGWKMGWHWSMLPLGYVIATAELVNCWSIVWHPGSNVDESKYVTIGAELDVSKKHKDFGRFIMPTVTEMIFGDWTPGRYAWELSNIRLLQEPIPAKGAQGLWNWTGETGVIEQPLFI